MDGRPRVFAILAALGGRYGWRFWISLAVWVVHATVARVNANADPSMFPFRTGAYESFTLVTLLAVLIIWALGSQLAVALGHRRGHVFSVTAAATLTMLVGAPVLAEIASHIEHTIVGRGGIRVLATRVPKVFEEGGEPVPGFALTELIRLVLIDLVYILPAFVAMVVAVCWWMRWSMRGLLPGLLLVPVAFLGHLGMWSLFTGFARGPRQHLLAEGLALAATVSVLLALAWLAFRRTPG